MPGTQRYVVVSFLVIGVLVWATLTRVFSALAYAVDISDPALIGSGFALSTLLGLVCAAGGVVYALRHKAARTFSSEVVSELMRVTWPSRQETQRSTVVVIVASLVMAVLLGVFDQIWGALTSLIYS